MDKDSKIYVSGHTGLVGSAIVRRLQTEGYSNLIVRTHRELDLCKQSDVEQFFNQEKPEYVFVASAKVGGILANSTYPADFIYSNLAIQLAVIHSAYLCGVKKLLFLGSSCIYPKHAPQPLKEEYLLTGALESTNEAYAIAKIAGIKMCQAYNSQYGTNFISAMPTNLYGPGDNFDLQSSHVLPALIRKFHEAKISGKLVTIWGTGKPRRELLFVDDLADACQFLMNHYDGTEIINVGVGKDISIQELAELTGEVVGYKGAIVYDQGKPDGTLLKRLDVSRINSLGWKASTELRDGIARTYQWYLKTYKNN
ncbi:MAG: GDP-L-fucose synthase [Nitrospirae bacterium]|nr:GDP-L-fucose synthase [Nitrospirota bacterium]